MVISGTTAKVLGAAFREFDTYLDNCGVPVAFRKYYIEDWLNRASGLKTSDDPHGLMVSEAAAAISLASLENLDSVASWYYDTYGEQSMTPPALSFVAAFVPFPLQVRVGSECQELLLPKTTSSWKAVKAVTERVIQKKPYLFAGLRALRAFPQTPWIALAQAEYDASIAAFFFPRPNYGHVLWHSLQVLEKCFKAVFRAHGWSEERLQGDVGHSLITAGREMAKLGFPLPAAAEKIMHTIMNWASPDSRYAEDFTVEARTQLRNRALKVHHLVLEVIALCAPALGEGIGAGLHTTALHRHWARDHQTFSSKVYDSYVEWALSGDMPYPTGGPGVFPIGVQSAAAASL